MSVTTPRRGLAAAFVRSPPADRRFEGAFVAKMRGTNLVLAYYCAASEPTRARSPHHRGGDAAAQVEKTGQDYARKALADVTKTKDFFRKTQVSFTAPYAGVMPAYVFSIKLYDFLSEPYVIFSETSVDRSTQSHKTSAVSAAHNARWCPS